VGISIYIWKVATESEMADAEGSTATVWFKSKAVKMAGVKTPEHGISIFSCPFLGVVGMVN
jgi:hypothetical protein